MCDIIVLKLISMSKILVVRKKNRKILGYLCFVNYVN